MARHRTLRAKAWASRWRWPLIFGGGAAVLFLINAKSASAAPAGRVPPSTGGGNPGNTLTALRSGASALPIQSGTANIPELPGTLAVSAPLVSSAASFWDTLTPGDSETAGYINFPSGSQSAATLFQTRYDEYGAPYVQWGGLTYILTGPDASGNYAATRVMV